MRPTTDVLAGGEIRVEGFLPAASNGTLLGEAIAEDRAVPVVYKPVAGEAPLWDFPDGTLAAREVAAYRLSRALGWPRIPATVLRDGPLGEGAVQLYVEHDPRQHYFTLRETRLAEFAPVAAFDVIANNADRKGGHCLLDPEGLIWVIDHGLCFHVAPKLRTVIWDLAGEPVPDELRVDLERTTRELRTGEIGRELAPLLSAEEIEQVARRAEDLAAQGRFPGPGPGRVVPWPPV